MEQSEVFSQQCLHPSFRVFGVSYDYKRLKVYAYTLSQDTTTYLSDIGNFILDWLSPKQDIQVTTSGSTGVPKQISIQKSQMYESALATGHFFKLSTSTKALLCLSSNYIAGKMMLVRAMVLGWDLHWVAPTASPLKGTDAMYSFVAMVPLQLQNSLQELFRVKKIIVGGGQVSQSLIKQLPSKETLVFETYGMTETVSHIAVRKLNHNEGDISYFEILPHIRIGVDDRSCLRITAPKLCDEVLQTNDIVDLKSVSSFEWKGRFDNVINSGGIKLFPEQIERKLASTIQSRFFVSYQQDVLLGNKLILIIETNALSSKGKESLLLEIKELPSLSKYEVPKRIYTTPSFIETATQKVKREAIRKEILGVND